MVRARQASAATELTLIPHPIRVYYEDTDFSGVVYHASYLRFMERGRTEFLRALGVEQGAAQASDAPGFAVRAMSIDFLKPARMDDLLEIETQITGLSGASIQMRQHVLRGADVLVAASVRVACVRAGRAVRLPAGLHAKLLQIAGASAKTPP